MAEANTTKMVLMLFARRAATTLATALIAHGAVAADQNAALVEILAGMLVWGAEFGLEWWRKTGMVMVSAQLARLKGIPLPADVRPPVVVPAHQAEPVTGKDQAVVVKSATP